MYNDNELYHYGIKGMKWGVRRAKKRAKKYLDKHEKLSEKARKEYMNLSSIENPSKKQIKRYYNKETKSFKYLNKAFRQGDKIDEYEIKLQQAINLKNNKKDYKKALNIFREMNSESRDNAAIIDKSDKMIEKFNRDISKNNKKLKDMKNKSANEHEINKIKNKISEAETGKREVSAIRKDAFRRNEISMEAMKQAGDHIVKYYGKESKVKYKTQIKNGKEFVKGISVTAGIAPMPVVDSKGNKRNEYSRVRYKYEYIYL